MIISKPSLNAFFNTWLESKNDIATFSKLICPFSADFIIYKLVESKHISLKDAVEYLFNTWNFKPGNSFRTFDSINLTKYRTRIFQCLDVDDFIFFFENVIRIVRKDFLFEQKSYNTPVNFIRTQVNSSISLLGDGLLSELRISIRKNSNLMAAITPFDGIDYNIDVLFELSPLFFDKSEHCNYSRKLCELTPELCAQVQNLRVLDVSAKTYGDLLFPSDHDSDNVVEPIFYG